MMKTRRFEYAAKMACDLVLGVREKCLRSGKSVCLKNLDQVDVTGFSFGVYLASRTCKYLYQKTDEKVRLLLGMYVFQPIPFY